MRRNTNKPIRQEEKEKPLKLSMTFEEAIMLAANTPPVKAKKKSTPAKKAQS